MFKITLAARSVGTSLFFKTALSYRHGRIPGTRHPPMTRASKRSKREAEDYFPHSVDILVPGTGLGSRLNSMLDWCRENTGDWAHHGHSVRGDPPRDYARFYFREADDAAAFRRRWAS
jgi:hypothetical protein